MVFSSVPPYIDHHHPNWHQVQLPNHQQPSLSQSPQLQPPPPLPPQVDGSGGGGIRPGSMVDRARLAKVPQPEAGLNCPRCDSTNTKFCYFNNYSLTQPRHFCKACRRYWTRGGALRNVPVGGGYRKNKRSKNTSGSSKSQVTGPSKSTSVSPSPSGTDASGHFPFMGSFQNLAQYGGGNVGPNLAEFQAQMAAAGGSGQADLGLQMGGTGGVEQQYWRFPFLGGFDTPTNFHQYQNQVKMEENQGLNLSKQFMGFSENSQYWGGNLFSGVNSSSTSSLL